MNLDANSLFGIQYWLWALASGIIAVIYYFIWPRPVNNINSRPMWRHLMLRYGHSLVWVLIMLSFLLRILSPTEAANVIADIIALTGFFLYMGFLATTVIDRRAPN